MTRLCLDQLPTSALDWATDSAPWPAGAPQPIGHFARHNRETDAAAVLPELRPKALPLGAAARISKWRLLDELRPLSAPRTRACRRRRISATVQLQRQADGSKRVAGVLSCGSVWACPVCAQRICSHRADEIKSAISEWTKPHLDGTPAGIAVMVTMTVRHALGNDLRKVRRGLANAWRRIWQGRKAKALRGLFHVKHHVRALEVTHGVNGWHPHLHVLMFCNAEPEEGALRELQERWIAAVEKALGEEHAPDFAHGVVMTRTSSASYLQKMGLELSHSFTKSGQRSSRTPWEIAQDAAAGDEQSAGLWRAYCRAMKGARQLTWSRGMRRFFGLGLRDSDAAVVEAEETAGGSLLVEWDGHSWDLLARSDPFWVSRVALCEDFELELLTGWLRAPRPLRFSPPDGEAGLPPARSSSALHREA